MRVVDGPLCSLATLITADDFPSDESALSEADFVCVWRGLCLNMSGLFFLIILSVWLVKNFLTYK